MKQTILIERPPVYDECIRVFGYENIHGREIVWSWGDKIYNPENADLPPEILAHEAVHGERQSADPVRVRMWWDKYLAIPGFRYNEELVAHQVEYHQYCRRHPNSKKRELMLNSLAQRLASPLYGSIDSERNARMLIRG